MAYSILSDKCVGCGECMEACPQEAITKEDDKCVINADDCAGCGICADSCPNEAIVEE